MNVGLSLKIIIAFFKSKNVNYSTFFGMTKVMKQCLFNPTLHFTQYQVILLLLGKFRYYIKSNSLVITVKFYLNIA